MTNCDQTITHCRTGERSLHIWLVLKHLLGYDSVKNCDGSWTGEAIRSAPRLRSGRKQRRLNKEAPGEPCQNLRVAGRRLEGVFPDAEYAPTKRAQLPGSLAVTATI